MHRQGSRFRKPHGYMTSIVHILEKGRALLRSQPPSHSVLDPVAEHVPRCRVAVPLYQKGCTQARPESAGNSTQRTPERWIQGNRQHPTAPRATPKEAQDCTVTPGTDTTGAQRPTTARGARHTSSTSTSQHATALATTTV